MSSTRTRLLAASAAALLTLSSTGGATLAQDHAGTDEAIQYELRSERTCSFSGTWDTSYGQMELAQDGDRVDGTYSTDSRIEGVVDDGVLAGRWSSPPTFDAESGDAGDIEFSLSDDCETFSGGFRYGSEGDLSSWDGSLVQRGADVPLPARRGDATECTFDGVWDTTYGQMLLTQVGTTVVGEYDEDERIEGVVLGDVLSGRWLEAPGASELDGDAGDLEFELGPSCTSFTGGWRVGASGGFTDWNGELRWALPATTVAAPAAQGALTAGEPELGPDAVWIVPILLQDAAALGALDFELRYDSGSLLAVAVEAGSMDDGVRSEVDWQTPGVIRFAIAAGPDAAVDGDAELARISFRARHGADPDSALRLDVDLARDTAGLPVSLDLGHASISRDAEGPSCDPALDASVALRQSVARSSEDLDLDLDVDGDLQVTSEDARRILAGATEEGCGAATPADADTASATSAPVTALAGDPAAPAAGAIPDLDFEPDGTYAVDPQSAGVVRSVDTLTVIFELDASVAAVNELLAEIGAEIVGGIPGIDGQAPGLLVLRAPTTDHSEMAALLERLESDPLVEVALPDALQEVGVVPPPGAALASMVGTPRTSCPQGACIQGWTWERDDQAQPTHQWPFYRDGNWGLELIRVPQMWNLNAAIEKAGGDPVVVGVIDAGYTEHTDLAYDWQGKQHSHGTHVAGTIGATHGNQIGIDGVSPFVTFALDIAKAPSGFERALSMTSLTRAIYDLARSAEPPRVINISMGYYYRNGPPTAQDQVALRKEGVMVGRVFGLLSVFGHEVPLVVVAAGNNGGLDARWSSGLANAALERDLEPILVVENVGRPGAPGDEPRISQSSSVDGNISAPGSLITSTYWSGPPFDQDNRQPGNCQNLNPDCYGTISGTSMAAPHVTGVAAYLFALEPSLTPEEVLVIMIVNSADTFDANGQVDAYASALDIDTIMDSDRVRRMLLDIDDGTPDGNSIAAVGAGVDWDADGDGGIGDGSIDMSDFRRWRDLLLVTEGVDVGPEWHLHDANGNGRFANVGDDENVFPRGDFNGDGKLDRTTRTAVAGNDGGGVWTDLAVLQSLFEDEHYAAADLPALVDSWDLEVDVFQCVTEAGATDVRSWIDAEASPASVGGTRAHPDGKAEIFTVPSGSWTARFEATAADGSSVDLSQRFSGLPGEDVFWSPTCPEVAPPTGSTTLERRYFGVEYEDGVRRGDIWQIDFEFDASGELTALLFWGDSRVPCVDGVCEVTNVDGVRFRYTPTEDGYMDVDIANDDDDIPDPIRACPYDFDTGHDCWD